MTPLTDTTRPIERHGSLKDAAYRQIKELLLSGRLDHGRLYSAQYFAEMLGVSRTPVREALLQLTGEGSLVCLDVRGFKVREFTDKEVRDVFETRQVIEAHVFGQLVDNQCADDIRDLERSLKAMAGCAARKDSLGFLEADKEFHLVPLRRAGNLHLQAIMAQIRDHIAILGSQALRYEGRYRDILREHSAIIQALRTRDRTKTVRAVRHHLAVTASHILEGAQAAANHH
jgi:DNA-binding GntR family transcriptional regulator